MKPAARNLQRRERRGACPKALLTMCGEIVTSKLIVVTAVGFAVIGPWFPSQTGADTGGECELVFHQSRRGLAPRQRRKSNPSWSAQGRARRHRTRSAVSGRCSDRGDAGSCAQAPVVADKPSSFDNNRQGAARKHASSASDKTDKRAAGTADGSYGLASFYGHQSRTASGEKFNPQELTAAHRTLPFGTRVRVTDVATGRSVTVRVNDRGPFVPGRVVDVSHSAAETLGMVGGGIAKVKLDVVQ